MRPVFRSRRAFANASVFLAAILLSTTILGAEWKIETVDTSGAGMYTSIKLSPSGDAHVAYIPENDQHPLKYAFWDHKLGRWFTMTVATNASFCTLALDSRDRPHISYADIGTAKGCKLRYAYWDGSNWKIQSVSPQTNAVVAYYTSIALDAHDNPMFSYYDYADPTEAFRLWLRSVFWMDGYWGVSLVDQHQGSGKFNSIAVDSKGHPHIAYANVRYESSGLHYASWNGKSWETETLEGAAAPTPVYSVSLIMDKQDNPHIAYSLVERNQVKYATRKNGVWHTEVVDSIEKVAYPDRNGIAIDENGTVYLSYYDVGAGSFKVASRGGGHWYIETLCRGTAGFTSALQVHDGTLWVSYADESEAALKIARGRLTDLGVSVQVHGSSAVARFK